MRLFDSKQVTYNSLYLFIGCLRGMARLNAKSACTFKNRAQIKLNQRVKFKIENILF